MSKREHFTPEQKVAIVRRHLLEGVPVSDLCDELGIHATQYYNWQKQLFENAAPAFERRPNKANQRRQEAAAERKIAQLEAKLVKKNEVVAELLGGARPVKKRTWGTINGVWVPHETRDTVVDYVRYWTDQAEERRGQLP